MTDTATTYAPPATPVPPRPLIAPRRPRMKKRNIAAHIVLIIISCVALLPVYWMVATSIKTPDTVGDLFPWHVRLENYLDVLRNKNNNFLLWTRNSVIVTLLTVIGTVSSSALVAYGFARIKFKGRGILFVIMISTMMIPFPVTMVAMLNIWKWLADETGIPFIGTFRPLWIPTFFGSAFNIFLLRQFFMTIPKELSEAARIDGCSEFGIFWRVILPLSKPALTVVALFAFMWAWNDFLAPLVYLKEADQFTLALGLQSYQSQQNGTPWHLLMAASVMVITPVMLLFFLAQKTFIQGISTTGLKG